jgi:hypothetical protein
MSVVSKYIQELSITVIRDRHIISSVNCEMSAMFSVNCVSYPYHNLVILNNTTGQTAFTCFSYVNVVLFVKNGRLVIVQLVEIVKIYLTELRLHTKQGSLSQRTFSAHVGIITCAYVGQNHRDARV